MHQGQRRAISSVLLAGIVCLVSVGNLPAQKPRKRSVQDVTTPASSTVQLGPYYALVIGNNNYRYVSKLATAVNDAKEVARLLGDRYGFTTKVLYDASRDDILTALVEYRRTLPENSSLLIYYAGHGHNDREVDEAYWLPVDAQADNNENWISADDITRDMRAIPSLHILIISDSCYSGALTRDADVGIKPSERGVFLAKMWQSKSRTLMASGGDEPVSDGGAGGHSVFANAILQGLVDIPENEFTAADLFQRVQPRVAGRSEQMPQYSLLRNSGDEFGDFVFARGGKGSISEIRTVTDTTGPEGTGPDVTEHNTSSHDGPVSNSGSDADAIKKVLDMYVQAYNFKDAAALWKIWPTAPAGTKQSIGNAFQSAATIKMTVQPGIPDVAPDGTHASVHGQFSQVFTPKNGSPQPRNDEITFLLKKDHGVWTLVDVK